MQESSNGDSLNSRIGKKESSFLLKTTTDKTSENLRREQQEQTRIQQEELERDLAPPILPSKIALSNFQEEQKDDNSMATASSLRERLKQYHELKAEQMGNATATKAMDETDSFMGPPITPKTDETKDETKEQEAPDESWVPKPGEGEEIEEEVEQKESSEVEEEPAVEEYEEEEVFEDDESEASSEREVEEEPVEYDEEEVTETGALTIDQDQGIFAILSGDDGTAGVATTTGQDQDVFRALDEAEKADRAINYPPAASGRPTQQSRAPPTSPAPPVSVKQRNAMPQREEIKTRQNCIIVLVIIVGMLAAAAIILPFVLDYNGVRSSGSPEEPSPTQAPVSTSPPAPTDGSPTAVPGPTEAPTTARLGQFIRQYLVPVSGEEVFEDPDSPQYQAAVYIADEDPYTSQLTSVEQLGDRYAAITFYYATNGDNWDTCYLGDESCVDGQWLVNDVCDWFSVSCNEAGRVTAFLFANTSGNGLRGSLPPEMLLLTEMTDLVITNNFLTGTLPDAFGQNATNVRSILLQGNQLEGTIANDYLEQSPLEVVSFANNSFTGSIPTNLGGASLLRTLDLSSNSFSGSIPSEIDSYQAMTELSLASNSLTSNIPESLFLMNSLERVLLDGNSLTGTLSSSVGNLAALEVLRIGDSRIEGFIPDELYSLPNLAELDISGAQFRGQLSRLFTNLAPSLTTLIVNNNSFGGTVPDSFGELTNLNVLELHANEFTGSISESICALPLEVLTADCSEITCDCCTECF